MTKNLKNIVSPFQLILVILSILSIAMLLMDLLIKLDPEISNIIQIGDFVICIFFIYDFIFRFIKADNKLEFMKWGWIDLFSSIPSLDIFRAGRLIRIIRLLRFIRLLRSTKMIAEFILVNRNKNIPMAALFIAFFLIFTGSVGILIVELPNTECNIKTAVDAIWW